MRKNVLVVSLAAAASLGCSGVRVVPQPSAVSALKPGDVPLPPQEPPAPEAESLNTEYCLGSCADEAKRFATFAEQMVALQKKQTSSRNQPLQRGFHGKAHGCLYGTFELAADRDARVRHGAFADGQGPWPVWVRFSNGVGWRQADDELDARGMAVKLMGVQGPRSLDDEKATQDFLMTNAPTPVGRNAEEFMVFAHENEKGRLPGLLFAAGHPRTAAPALLKTDPIPSAATAQYWSGGAFHLGAHQAVKFTSKPCAGTKERKPGDRKDPDYLRKDLEAASAEGLCFSFYVQLQADPEKTPIEHASREWKEADAPLLHVGDIRMPPQSLADERRTAFCEKLSYNPWHGTTAHQPMGHVNRARRFVYDASRAGRSGGYEPTGFEGFDAPKAP
ncbi:MAG: hypothetical protein RL653_3675 [Pseudomonadota bacterium]|jgi:catalase